MKYFAILFLSLVVSQSFAHMEDKLGPNGGFIRMPGPFHVELNFDAMKQIHIFLLDANFENPTIENSEIKVVYSLAKKDISLKCGTLGTTQFVCDSASVNLKKGKLMVTAKRSGAQGNEAIYELPLRLDSKPVPKKNKTK